MRKLVITAALAATTALAGTASANIIYTLNGVDMNSMTNGLGCTCGNVDWELRRRQYYDDADLGRRHSLDEHRFWSYIPWL